MTCCAACVFFSTKLRCVTHARCRYSTRPSTRGRPRPSRSTMTSYRGEVDCSSSITSCLALPSRSCNLRVPCFRATPCTNLSEELKFGYCSQRASPRSICRELFNHNQHLWSIHAFPCSRMLQLLPTHVLAICSPWITPLMTLTWTPPSLLPRKANFPALHPVIFSSPTSMRESTLQWLMRARRDVNVAGMCVQPSGASGAMKKAATGRRATATARIAFSLSISFAVHSLTAR